MLYPLSHGCGRLVRLLAAEQHRESVSAHAAPTNREQPALAESQLSSPAAAIQADLAQQPGRRDPVANQENTVPAVNRGPVSPGGARKGEIGRAHVGTP